MLKKLAQVKNNDSLSNSLRRKRFELFLELTRKLSQPIKIIDIGGTQNYWEKVGFFKKNEVVVTLVNLRKDETTRNNFKSMRASAIDLRNFYNKDFDLVYSNSTIEHLGSFENQKKMAEEILSFNKPYIVQTPNKYFPIEPHFLFPFFQFLPMALRVLLLQHFNLGWRKRQKNKQKALESVSEIRLMNREELKKIFPEGTLVKERFFGLTKSFIIYGGFN